MAITGFMMWNPITTSKYLPGEVIPAAKAAHGAEAVLAVLAIIMWFISSKVITGIITLMACQILFLIHSRGRPKKWLTQYAIQRNMEKMSREEMSSLLSERTIEMAETGLTVSSLNMTP